MKSWNFWKSILKLRLYAENLNLNNLLVAGNLNRCQKSDSMVRTQAFSSPYDKIFESKITYRTIPYNNNQLQMKASRKFITKETQPQYTRNRHGENSTIYIPNDDEKVLLVFGVGRKFTNRQRISNQYSVNAFAIQFILQQQATTVALDFN